MLVHALKKGAALRCANAGIGHQREAGDLLRISRRIECCDMATHGVAYHVHAPDRQRFGEGGQPLGLGADVIAAMRTAASAETRQVDSDNVIALGKVTGEPQPRAFVCAKAVHQQYGIGTWRAALVIAHRQVIHADAALMQPGAPLFDGLVSGQLRGW